MKTILIFITVIASSLTSYCQDTIELKDMIVPSSPAFNLLDVSPKTVERPATVKALALSIVNSVGQDNGFPKNFALEFSPFWLLKHPSMSFFKYNGIHFDSANKKRPLKQNIFYGLQNTSISIASILKDSSKSVPLSINYIGYSIRTNIINLRKKRVIDSLTKAGLDLNRDIIKVADNASNICLQTINPESSLELNNCIKHVIDSLYLTELNKKRRYIDTILTIRPVFTLDAAFASSFAFANNTFSDNHSYRTGGWLTLGYSQPLLGKTARKTLAGLYNAKNYINIYGLFRIMKDNSTKDFKQFTEQTFLDFGGRLEFEFSRFALSYEIVRRNVKNNDNLSSFRNAGIIQYKINNNLFLTGTFGKNFGSVNNLIAFLGINFGFGSTSSVSKFSK